MENYRDSKVLITYSIRIDRRCHYSTEDIKTLRLVERTQFNGNIYVTILLLSFLNKILKLSLTGTTVNSKIF